MMTWETLVESTGLRETLDFEAIFSQYQHSIHDYVYRLMGNEEDARDLTQEAFIKAYVALPKAPPDLKVRPWLYKIATNTCLDELRRRKKVRWQPLEQFLSVFHPAQVAKESPERDVMRREEANGVQSVLNALPERYRLCLLLREYYDMSCSEIGQVMDLSSGAVKSLLFRARESFRTAYAKTEGDPDRHLA